MCSESLPKDFVRDTELVAIKSHGLSSVQEFQRAENEAHHREILIKVGLTDEELKLYEDSETGRLEQRTKVESSVLKNKIDGIYEKINKYQKLGGCSKQENEKSTPTTTADKITNGLKRNYPLYPEGHPMNDIKNIEEELFANTEVQCEPISLTKRRKMWRRLIRKKERLEKQRIELDFKVNSTIPEKLNGSKSLWDVRDAPRTIQTEACKQTNTRINKLVIGPKKPIMYTIKDNKIVRLEPVKQKDDEYRAVDIVMPVNVAEQNLLEGTKMPVDEIKKMERFKDYEPGMPSKVLYLKNIAPSVSQERLALLFKQFTLANAGPVEVKLMSGRMRGQAFVAFHDENIAIRALEEVNGTILSGRPVIAQFGRNSNRIQDN